MNLLTRNEYCPCCGYDTFDISDRYNYSICPICFWEDDLMNLKDPEYEGGANGISLIQAQNNFVQYGACNHDMISNTRKPKTNDKRSPEWRVGLDYKFSFRQEILRYILGHITSRDLPSVAIVGIEEGFESDSLNILAGLDKNENSFEIDSYYKKTAQELSISIPDKQSAAIELSLFYADLVIERKIDPIYGVNNMIRKCFDYCDFGEIKEYAMDNIRFEVVYGLYWSFDDLIVADNPWSKKKSNEALLEEIKEEIITELGKWRTLNVLQQWL